MRCWCRKIHHRTLLQGYKTVTRFVEIYVLFWNIPFNIPLFFIMWWLEFPLSYVIRRKQKVKLVLHFREKVQHVVIGNWNLWYIIVWHGSKNNFPFNTSGCDLYIVPYELIKLNLPDIFFWAQGVQHYFQNIPMGKGLRKEPIQVSWVKRLKEPLISLTEVFSGSRNLHS